MKCIRVTLKIKGCIWIRQRGRMIVQFGIEGKQASKYLKWRLKHRKCERKAGAIGGAISITFIPTGIGTIVEAKCGICDKALSLTDSKDLMD